MNKLNILLFFILGIAVVAMFFLFKARVVTQQVPVNYPFFLSTKFSTSNVRAGPGKDFPVVWIYKQKEIPFKVIAEYKDWYQIENYEGNVGWIFKNTTSATKYAILKNEVEVFSQANKKSVKVATLAKGIIVKMLKQDSNYVKIYLFIKNQKVIGWVLENNLWGKI